MDKSVARFVWHISQERLQKGEVPLLLGIPGMLALIYDKIRRYNKGLDKEELIELASDALFIVELLEVLTIDPEPEPIPMPRNEIEDQLGSIAEVGSTSNTDESVPEEFANWQNTPKQAAGLLEYLKQEGMLDLVGNKMIRKIEEASKSSEST